MKLQEAIQKAKLILDEERHHSTVGYSPPEAKDFVSGLRQIRDLGKLDAIRMRPRQVCEDTSRFVFKSTNYELLCALLSQLSESDRDAFIGAVVERLSDEPGYRCKHTTSDLVDCSALASELPLVVEFCVRQGKVQAVLDWLKLDSHAAPKHALVFRHIEDMITFNFRVYREHEYPELARAVATIQLKPLGEWPGLGLNQRNWYLEIGHSRAAVIELCRKARYLHIKRTLEQGLNVEINQDKTAVESYLKAFGFSETLIGCLNKAEELYQGPSSGFDLKSCMGHLRSFLEQLHAEAILAAKPGTVAPMKWGERLAVLRDAGVLSKQEDAFAASLYVLISDEGVHPLIAEREYARLARNMVIEYGLLFLQKLGKLGIERSNAVAQR